MSSLKNQIGQICLVVALLALIVSTLLLAMRVDQLSTEIQGLRQRVIRPGSDRVGPIDLDEFARAQKALKQPLAMAPEEEPAPSPAPVVRSEIPVQVTGLVREPFKLLFKAYSADGQNFQINVRDRTYIVANVGDEIGDRIERTDYRITGFVKKNAMVNDPSFGGAREVDVSELTLQHADDAPIVLVLGRAAQEPEPMVLIRCGEQGPVLKVRRGQPIVCNGKSYKVVEITGAGAVIEDESTGKKHNVALPGRPQ